MCEFLFDVKVNSNRGIKLKTRMSFFIRLPLFLYNAKVNLNYCVGVKEKRPKKSYRNQGKDSEKTLLKIPKLKSFNIKTNFRCHTNYIWEFVVNVK